jgi:hypothetical protein
MGTFGGHPRGGSVAAYGEHAMAVVKGKRMQSWILTFLLRHTAFHVMDHAWEMEDKDLSGEAAT